MAHTKQTARKSTGGMANQGKSARFSQSGEPDDAETPKKKPDPKYRPKLASGKSTPMKREQRTM